MNKPPRKKLWQKRLFRVLISFLVLLTLLAVFHQPILRAIGRYLIVEDQLEKADAIIVLSGSAYERGLHGIALYQQGWAPRLVTTGGSLSYTLFSLGIKITEAEITAHTFILYDIPDTVFCTLDEGTSTYEEAAVLLRFAQAEGMKKIIIVSSDFHTRRTTRVFRKRFRGSGIKVLVSAAPPLKYDPEQWWKSEEGLIFVNNEYIKLLYYWWKY